MSKTTMEESISKIQKGEKDTIGNTVLNVLVRNNEYVIYETDSADINDRLKVHISGHSDEEEKKIINRFLKVKQKYIEAKGILYRSSNFAMMKNRIAHALSSALSSDEIDGEKEFEELIKKIDKEFNDNTINRYAYIIPAFVITILFSILLFINMDWRYTNYANWQVIFILFSSSIGGSMSILSGIGKYSFNEYLSPFYYLMLGIERLFLSGLAGVITYIAMRSGIIFQPMDITNYWGFMIIIVTAGFSEALVPTMLNKISNKQNIK